MNHAEVYFSPDNSSGGGINREIPRFDELPRSLKVAFDDLVGYAGFAPPANTDPVQVVENYSQYLEGVHYRMLDQLIQRAIYKDGKTGELKSDLDVLESSAGIVDSWQVSALLSVNPLQDRDLLHRGLKKIRDFNTTMKGKAYIGTLEVAAGSAADVDTITAELGSDDAPPHPMGMTAYVEVPQGETLDETLEAIAGIGDIFFMDDVNAFYAKFRTGGPNPPSLERTAHFMIKAAELRLPYKLTGRLHGLLAHTVVGSDGREIDESGYLNVVLAAALAQYRTTDPTLVIQMLKETDIDAFDFTDRAVSWNGQDITTQEIRATRKFHLHSIGSCSFEEPVAELAKLPKAT